MFGSATASPYQEGGIDDAPREPISLGFTCATKFQIARRMHRAEHPHDDLETFRRRLLSPSPGQALYERHVFDWLITQFSGVLRAMQADLHDCFRREEFVVRDGCAYHTRLFSQHPHDFHAADPSLGLTERDIDEQYEGALAKFEHLAGRFRSLRERPGRYLYVVSSLPYVGHVEAAIEWLAAGSPDHDFKLLLVGSPDEGGQPYDTLGDRVSWVRMPSEVRKAPAFAWEGDDDHWDAVLEPFRLAPVARSKAPVAVATEGFASPHPNCAGFRAGLSPGSLETFMTLTDSGLDLSDLKAKGVQVLRGFFTEEVRRDLAARAQEIIELRDAGKLTIDSQDTQGLPYEWFEPLLKSSQLIDVAIRYLGPDIVAAGWRVLAKDKHFKGAVHVHQDWPYNFGGSDKITIFLPLTQVNADNGGLVFLEESHQYGPVSRGSIDLSRFPPMREACPSVEVGDLILCDYLTWHYSNKSSNGEERILLQLNYQPASDPSSKNLVAGRMPHDKVLVDRFDAVSLPSTEMNAVDARAALTAGNVDRASRLALGLVTDDPDNVPAALLLYDILSDARNPRALQYLEQARASTKKLARQIAERDAAFGGGPVDTSWAEGPAVEADNSPWKRLEPKFRSLLPSHPDADVLPATLGTPELAWGYGALSSLLVTDRNSTLRIRAKAVNAEAGVCLVTEDCSSLASEAHVLRPEDGESTIMIAFTPEQSPVRVLLRNQGEQGASGEVILQSIDQVEYA